MQQNNLNIPALLGARICHDLISPIGAIRNGLELLTLTGDAHGPEVGLITDSADSANARLKLFRIAFGGGSSGQMMSCNEMAEILASNYGDGHLRVQFDGHDGLKKSDAKVLFLMMMCCESGMAGRGSMTLSADLSLVCRGDTLPDAHPLWSRLIKGQGWPDDLEAANVHFPLAQTALDAAGLRLCCTKTEQRYQIWTEPALSDWVINHAPSRPLRQGT